MYRRSNVVITYIRCIYDIKTQRAKRLLGHLLLGHLHDITDMAAAPGARHGAQHLFATAACSGDVKIWDTRCRGGAAAIMLTTGVGDPMHAVVLAANNSSSSSGASQLGAGMYCFAGGMGQSIWAWAVRGGQGQVLFQLSTGNLDVNSLAWREGSSSLIANCDADSST
jgi:hypothetical protein